MFEAYTVAVRVSLRGASAFTAGLMRINRAFMRAHGGAKALEDRMRRIKLLMVGGAALTGGGLFGLHLITKSADAARGYAEELAYMRYQAGLTTKEINSITSAAWRLTKVVPTMSAEGFVKTMVDLRSIFGAQHLDMAIATAPKIAQTEALLSQMGAKNADEQAFNIAKTLEMLGHGRNVEDFTKHLDLMIQGMQAFHAKIMPRDFQNTVTYLRSTRYGLSDEFLFKWLPTLMLEYKGGGRGGGRTGPGNAIASLISNITYGQLSQKSIAEFQRIGWVDPSKIKHIKGHGEVLLPGAIKDAALMQSDPHLFAQALVKDLYRQGKVKNDKDVITEAAFLAPNRTSNDILTQLMIQAWKFERDKVNIDRAIARGDYNKLRQYSPTLVHEERAAQLHNVMVRLGTVSLPLVMHATRFLTTWLEKLNAAMTSNPGLVKALVYGIAGLSVAAVVLGPILMLAAAVSAIGIGLPFVIGAVGTFVAGIAAVAAPALLAVGAAAALALGLAFLSRFIARHWKDVKKAASDSMSWIARKASQTWHDITTIAGNTWNAASTLFVKIKNGITGFLGDVWAWIRHHFIPGFMDGPQSRGATPGGSAPGGKSPAAYHPLGHGGGRSPVVAPLHIKTDTTITVPVHLDGRQIAEVTAKHMNRAMGYGSHVGRHDPTATLPPAGLGYA